MSLEGWGRVTLWFHITSKFLKIQMPNTYINIIKFPKREEIICCGNTPSHWLNVYFTFWTTMLCHKVGRTHYNHKSQHRHGDWSIVAIIGNGIHRVAVDNGIGVNIVVVCIVPKKCVELVHMHTIPSSMVVSQFMTVVVTWKTPPLRKNMDLCNQTQSSKSFQTDTLCSRAIQI